MEKDQEVGEETASCQMQTYWLDSFQPQITASPIQPHKWGAEMYHLS